MNYKVLYRKYRPTNFEEVVGQNNTIELIKDSIYNDKISHAYIFSGPRGTGKTSTAKIFAKAINCSCNDGVKPCGKCVNCLGFSENNDVYEIDAASNNGVDQIREIIDNIKLSPINSRYKVYIIDEVHMLSTSAFNALLLTLEEPPSHVVFILATTDIEDVPITVLSRCQRLDFKKISNKDIKYMLKFVSEKEKIDIDDAAIEEIAEFSDGGLRDALSILDQLSKIDETITQEVVLDSIGLVSTKGIIELIQNIDLNNVNKIVEFIENVREKNADYKTLVKKIIQILKIKAINEKNGIERGRLSYSDYKNLCFELSNTLYKSNVHVDSYALMELILLDYVDVSSDNVMISEPLSEDPNNHKEIGRDLDLKTSKNNDKYLPLKNRQLANIRINNCFVKANKKFLQNFKEKWHTFITTNDDKQIKGTLFDTEIVLASNEIIVIKTDFDENADNINCKLDLFETEFGKFIDQNIKLIAISNNNWQQEMEKFKNNLKNNIEYKYIEEPSDDDSKIELNDIFVSHKIEVK